MPFILSGSLYCLPEMRACGGGDGALIVFIQLSLMNPEAGGARIIDMGRWPSDGALSRFEPLSSFPFPRWKYQGSLYLQTSSILMSHIK